MKNNVLHRFLHIALFILLLFLVWLNIATSTPLDQQTVGSVVATGVDSYMCIHNERKALLDFKASIDQDPLGRFSTWTHEEATNNCCEWHGVTCNNVTGHVISLDLSLGNIEGKISPSLLNLSNLSYLNLQFNIFSGTVPIFIGSMTQLTYLDLSVNGFTGAIPKSIGYMTQLTYLDLGVNGFTGAIPKSIGSMTKLTYLDLGVNGFSGAVPKSIGSLTQLRYLRLGRNDFTGTIPPELVNLTNLQVLSLGFLGSCIVENLDWLSHMSELEALHMEGIFLGKAENWVNVISSLKKLSRLYLWSCNLSQVVHPYSSSSVNTSSSIVTLNLGNNNLNSSMYNWLFLLTGPRLVTLDLYGNKLDGIPTYLGNLCNLTFFSFVNNTTPISFPDFLKNLSGCTSLKLKTLTFSNSQFTGSLSNDIQNLSSLYALDLSKNKLNGTISEKVWLLPKLTVLDVSSNLLEGDISDGIGKSKIVVVSLSNNSLRGVLSEAHIANMSNADKIALSSNNLYGPIPNIPSTLQWLDLSKNNFSGGLSFLCNIVNSSLSYLDLSNNLLIGQIPECLWHFKELQVLNLGYNKLFGRIPTSVKYLINLEVFYLNNNNFSGELPLSLNNCTNLNFLYLGANGFSGSVPFWIGEKLSLLYALSLTSNNFSGTIPSQLCQLVELQVLDFSRNHLHGTIPSCLNNLTAMVQDEFSSQAGARYYHGDNFTAELVDHVSIQWQGNIREFSRTLRFVKCIDFSSNKLTGEIPYQLTNLYQLLTLNLSNNALIGEIPQKIGEMKELQILDLSRNNITGKIPSSMSQMTLLNYLDVSYNNLFGRIPSSTQLQSFEPSRYTGNTGLCGLPLSIYCPGDKERNVPPIVGESEDDEVSDVLDKWFYIGGAIGFAISFWTVCSLLLVYHRGRHAFFHFMNSLENWVYVKGTVFMLKVQQRIK